MSVITRAPVRASTVVILTPHEIVTVGLRAMLAESPAALRFLPADTDDVPDIVLYDVVSLLDDDGSELDHWAHEVGTTLVALTRPLRPDLGTRALQLGAVAALPLSSSSTTVRAVVHDALAGTLAEQNGASPGLHHDRLGAEVGLSPREIDVLREVVNGLSNHEVADELYLSINSVKTYIRSAYRKIGVTTRAQAVSWCVRNGFPAPAPPS
jgi:DNA-binding NarL/FixJ family response regulator